MKAEFAGIERVNKTISNLIFTNSSGASVKIPVDKKVAEQISMYLSKIVSVPIMPIESQEDG